jgi:spermidine synthase
MKNKDFTRFPNMHLFQKRFRDPANNPVQISEKAGVRYLHLGNATVQSAMRIDDPDRLELAYIRAMVASLLFVRDVRAITVIGLGGGSMAKFFHARLPSTYITAVEINPRVATAARIHFLLPPDDERLQVIIGDGAKFVPEHPGSCDLLLLDGFDCDSQSQPLATEEYYQHCARSLRIGGVLVVNLWGSDPKFQRYVERLDRVFAGRILRLPAEKRSNVIVFAFPWHAPIPTWTALLRRADALEAEHGFKYSQFLHSLHAANPGCLD